MPGGIGRSFSKSSMPIFEPDRPPTEGLKTQAFRLIGQFKEWAKQQLYRSPIGGFLSIRALDKSMRALKTHSTAVELFQTMRDDIKMRANCYGDDYGNASVPQKKALAIVAAQLDTASRNKAKAEAAVKSSRRNAKFVIGNEKHAEALNKFKQSKCNIHLFNISRKELKKIFKEVKNNVTKKFTPGILTRGQKAKDEMKEVKTILLDSLDASNVLLSSVKETKTEKEERLNKSRMGAPNLLYLEDIGFEFTK